MNENYIDDRFEQPVERRPRRAVRHGGEWIGGAVILLIGVLLLGNNLKLATFDNWWALFILLPALGSFSTAWGMVQTTGRFTLRARSATIVGVVLTLVTTMFLLELDWTYLGPGLLILAGAALFLNSLLPE